MKRSHLFLIALMLLVVVVAVVLVVGFLGLQSSRLKPPASLDEAAPAKAKFVKGKTAFFYPADWQLKDVPLSGGLISVQVNDPDDFIVFIASSNTIAEKANVKGVLAYEKELALAGVKGKERLWEDAKADTVVFRADGFEFEKRFYRFELFTVASRKTKAERVWREILDSVQFISGEEGIEAIPQ